MNTQNTKHAKIAEKVINHHERVAKIVHQVAKDKHPALPTEEDFHEALRTPCGELISELTSGED